MTADFNFKFPIEVKKIMDNSENIFDAAKAGFDEIKKDIPKNIDNKKADGDKSEWNRYYDTFKKKKNADRYIKYKRDRYGRGPDDILKNSGEGAKPDNYDVVRIGDEIGILAKESISYMQRYNDEDGEFNAPNGASRIRRYLIWNKSTKRRFSNAFRSAIIKKLER